MNIKAENRFRGEYTIVPYFEVFYLKTTTAKYTNTNQDNSQLYYNLKYLD